MNTIARLILLTLLAFLFESVFAAGNITTTDFKIELAKMDPVNPNPVEYGGKGALFKILESFSELLLFTIPIIAVISIIIAGYFYVFSSGDAEKANRGKTIIKWNLVAIFVAFFSWTLVRLIASLFG